MRRYELEKEREGSTVYFFIRDVETLDIVLLPTKYLMHKIRSKCSPNTVRRSALVTVRNLKGCGRFEDTILASIIKTGEQNLKKAFEKKVHVAVGSDAGAYQVLHGQGVQDESRAFFDILGDTQAVRSWMEDGEKRIRTIFRHGSSNLIQV